MKAATYLDGVQYATDVTSGDIVSCKYVKQACQRFLDDLERKDWEWEFHPDEANKILLFMENAIVHVKGPLAGEKIKLEPWQTFILINIYGWWNAKGVRRFNYVILEIARKNGKSIFASALALYEMAFGQEGGEVYSLATKRDQAKICWDVAARMIQRGPASLKKRYKTTQAAIVNYENWSKYVALGRDKDTHDGLNPSMNIFDEAAAYKDRNTVDVMTSATGSRAGNFVHLFITTAQFDKTTVYYDNRSYLVNLLDKKFDDDRWFGVIYTLDEGDEYTDEDVWVKANPNLDVSVDRTSLRSEIKQAKELKSKRNGVLVKHFNVWTSSSESWIDTNYWNNPDNIVPELDMRGKGFMGLDLAMTRDLCAATTLFVAGPVFHAEFKCFIPESAMVGAPHHIKPIYKAAHEAGVLVITPGDITDYNIIQQYVENMNRDYNIEAVAYDPYNSTQLITNLEDSLGDKLLEVKQGISHISPAAKETERLIVGDKIHHLDDPFIAWQLENCTVYPDLNENIKVRKGDDANLKIDSIIALIMAVSLASGHLEKPKDVRLWFLEE